MAWAPTLYILMPEHTVFCFLIWCSLISNPLSSLHGLILQFVLCFPILEALRICMCWGVDYLLIQVTSVYPFFCNLFLQVVLHPHRPIHSPLVPVFMFPFQICVCADPSWCPCSSVSCTSNLKGSTTTLQQMCPHRNLRWAMPVRLPFLPFVLGRPYSDPTLVHVSYCNLTKPWEFVAFIERKNPCIE